VYKEIKKIQHIEKHDQKIEIVTVTL